ncbi:MAG: SLC13 family permease [Rhizobiales bacterium]|nr:SLC13 family permease [Hyphomicrobiales bacterium]
MNLDQLMVFGLLAFVFAMLIWGKLRYDLVAFSALVIALVIGIVPVDQAFSGFGHPATVIIALVLIVSRGLQASGAIELVAQALIKSGRSLSAHIGVMSGLVAVLSAFMNNVGALALLMPVDIDAAKKAKRSPALTLMPLSFASILGGMVTLIGTPPNIIIASFREKSQGTAFSMFDFAPVGLVVATVGVIFIALIGWRLIPSTGSKQSSSEALMASASFVAELRVADKSKAIDRKISDLDEDCEENDVSIVGLVRNGHRKAGRARREVIQAGDILIIQATADSIDKFLGFLDLEYVGSEQHGEGLKGVDLTLSEVVVTENSRIVGRTAYDIRLLHRKAVTLLGVSRQGKKITERVRKLKLVPGDILLLLGPSNSIDDTINWLECLPLAKRGLTVIQRDKAMWAAGIFAAGILLASFGYLYLAVALAIVVILYIVLKIVPAQQVYHSIEWPIIILLGSLIPIGSALEASGGTETLANAIVSLANGAPAWVLLTLLMLVTMTLSDVLNNTATAVIAAPIAVNIANSLNASPDPFLMAVAVAASCAFLTPIGHKNNTLIMGPGGYKFSDYWRMGLPLEVLVVIISVPTIIFFWPLYS